MFVRFKSGRNIICYGPVGSIGPIRPISNRHSHCLFHSDCLFAFTDGNCAALRQAESARIRRSRGLFFLPPLEERWPKARKGARTRGTDTLLPPNPPSPPIRRFAPPRRYAGSVKPCPPMGARKRRGCGAGTGICACFYDNGSER